MCACLSSESADAIRTTCIEQCGLQLRLAFETAFTAGEPACETLVAESFRHGPGLRAACEPTEGGSCDPPDVQVEAACASAGATAAGCLMSRCGQDPALAGPFEPLFARWCRAWIADAEAPAGHLNPATFPVRTAVEAATLAETACADGAMNQWLDLFLEPENAADYPSLTAFCAQGPLHEVALCEAVLEARSDCEGVDLRQIDGLAICIGDGKFVSYYDCLGERADRCDLSFECAENPPVAHDLDADPTYLAAWPGPPSFPYYRQAALSAAPGEQDHWLGTRLAPRQWPYRVDAVEYTLLNELGEGCSSDVETRARIWKTNGATPGDPPEFAFEFPRAGEAPPASAYVFVRHELPEPIVLMEGEALVVAVQMTGDPAGRHLCVAGTDLGRAASGVFFWSNAVRAPSRGWTSSTRGSTSPTRSSVGASR
jgi:hypothetical protein